jgi:inner membrane protein YidH
VGEQGKEEKPIKGQGTNDTVRDHLANKRTMLAWARTGIAVMALGFVVARFGLLLRELRLIIPRPLPEGVSTVFGTTLVTVGGLLVILAALDYLRTGRAIDDHAYQWSPVPELALGLLLVLAAAVLAVYLVLTS